MQPVQGGFETHRIKGDGDYEAQKRAALAQSGKNSYIQGLQDVMIEGPGKQIKNTRDPKYGNVNIMPPQVLEGQGSNFQAVDTPGNRVLNDPINQTGAMELQTSATRIPHEDPQEFETSALDNRLAMMAKGGMNNLNDIPRLYGRG